ncbi:MAG: hypothetical protein ACI30I_07895 [Parabacteroides sp.]
MTATEKKLTVLPEETKAQLDRLFGDVHTLYILVYLIARNEHLTGLEKPDRYEIRLQVIRQIRQRLEKIISDCGLDGTELVADIASDYFEDYVNYREPDIQMDNDTFLRLLNQIAQYR